MDKITFQKLLRRTILVPFGVAAILASTLILEVQSLVNRAGWVEHTDQVIDVSDRLSSLRLDQETGLRAYLLTNDERFLQRYREGRDAARNLQDQLRQLISDNSEQLARNDEAIQAHEEWQSFADQAIAMAKTGQDVSDTKFQLRGKELMDQYRSARTAFVVREQQLRNERQSASRRALWFVNVSVVALCIVIGGVLSILGRRQALNLSSAFNSALDTG